VNQWRRRLGRRPGGDEKQVEDTAGRWYSIKIRPYRTLDNKIDGVDGFPGSQCASEAEDVMKTLGSKRKALRPVARHRQDPHSSNRTKIAIREIAEHKRIEESLRSSQEELREFAARIDAVREEERARIAREIHDELGQALTIFKMDLAWLQSKTNLKNSGGKKLKSMIVDVDQTIERVRNIVSDLRPSILDDLGLTAAVEWQLSQFQERTGIRSTFESGREDFSLPQDIAAALFRVVQEALTNVVRHAEASQVRVAMKAARGILRIQIKDDGKGVTRQQLNNRRSFGIIGMRERVRRIGGEVNISSGPGRGTRLEIVVPLK
jgi:signal transduction histidine kinase